MSSYLHFSKKSRTFVRLLIQTYMKTDLLTLISFPFVLATCLICTSCKKDEPADYLGSRIAYSGLIGLWNVADDPAGAKATTLYYRFADDGSAERFDVYEGKTVYVLGTAAYANTWLSFAGTDSRYFIYQAGYPRLVFAAKDDQTFYLNERFRVDSLVGETIAINIAGEKRFLVKTEKLSARWKEEFYEPEKPVSASDLLVQWDLLSAYEPRNGMYQYRTTANPQAAGITFLENGALTNCQFLIDALWEKLTNENSYTQSEQVFVYYSDCSWQLSNDRLSLYCATYYIQTVDDAGNIIAQQQVIPETPVQLDYRTSLFTGNWLVLYNNASGISYAFRRASDSSAQTPQRCGASPATSKQAFEPPSARISVGK